MGYQFYAVRKGRKTGIFTTWAECQDAVKGFQFASFKGFNDRAEAEAFVGSAAGSASLGAGSPSSSSSASSGAGAVASSSASAPRFKYYAVRRGRTTGIFESWYDVVQSTQGFHGPSFRGFNDYSEAEAFLGTRSSSKAPAAAEAEPRAITSSSSNSSSSSSHSSYRGHQTMLAGSTSSSETTTWRIRAPKPVPAELASMIARPTAKLFVRFDGGARGNPGVAGSAAVVINAFTSEVVACSYAYIGDRQTNNVAEYTAIQLGVKLIKQLNLPFSRVQAVEGDSSLVINQLKGEWRVKEPHLQLEVDNVGRLAQELKDVEGWGPTAADAQRKFVSLLGHVRREGNAEADHYSNVAMDSRGKRILVDGGFFIRERKKRGDEGDHYNEDDDDEVQIVEAAGHGAAGHGAAGSSSSSGGVGSKRKAPVGGFSSSASASSSSSFSRSHYGYNGSGHPLAHRPGEDDDFNPGYDDDQSLLSSYAAVPSFMRKR